VEGRENIPPPGPAILLPKHQFWTDIPIVALAVRRPMSYIAKQELFVYPFVREFMQTLGGIPLDRLNPVKSLDSFRCLKRLLQRREWIVLFPEGTYYPQTMGPGKHRLIQLLLRLQDNFRGTGNPAIPFVPIGIQYHKKKIRTEVRVKIGPPIISNGEMGGREFTRRILGDIAQLSGFSPEVPGSLRRETDS
jgi:1-acyl-sn-glycerol-3-phosphate acyltransferase